MGAAARQVHVGSDELATGSSGLAQVLLEDGATVTSESRRQPVRRTTRLTIIARMARVAPSDPSLTHLI